MTVREIIAVHPRPSDLDRDLVIRCIEACIDCAAACTSCADASLSEEDVEDLVRCIRLCLDCADVCEASGRIVTRQSQLDRGVVRAVIEACSVACRTCGDECERHATHHEHCRICAEACRRCEQACDSLVATIG